MSRVVMKAGAFGRPQLETVQDRSWFEKNSLTEARRHRDSCSELSIDNSRDSVLHQGFAEVQQIPQLRTRSVSNMSGVALVYRAVHGDRPDLTLLHLRAPVRDLLSPTDNVLKHSSASI